MYIELCYHCLNVILCILHTVGQQSGEETVEPSVSDETQYISELELRRSDSRLKVMMRDDLLISVRKFSTQVCDLL